MACHAHALALLTRFDGPAQRASAWDCLSDLSPCSFIFILHAPTSDSHSIGSADSDALNPNELWPFVSWPLFGPLI